MLISENLFWISLTILFYCYIGYGILLFLINKFTSLFRHARPGDPVFQPAITLIISAYNEEHILKEKIANTLQIDYPKDQLTVIFITDGSVDRSMEMIKANGSFTLLHQPERKGKLAAIKRAMQIVTTPIVVFSDANSMLNSECLTRIANHYRNATTGGVAGEKKILKTESSAVGKAEGLYWQYESFMKKQDAAFNTVVGAAGELFSVRTELFVAPEDHIILDDFVISMNVCLKGYKIEYEPRAYATEMPSANIGEERKRKIRISAGAYQSIGVLKKAFNFFRHPLLTIQYLSRRVLRWVVCPVMLIALFISNFFIVVTIDSFLFNCFLIAQVAFYLAAIVGWIMMKRSKSAGIFTVPFYFLFMNWCLIIGFTRFAMKKQTVIWDKSARQAVS